MTKKFLGILAMLSIAAMTVLSSCTAAGVECGLIGKWEAKETLEGITMTQTIEITSDDKYILEVKYSDGYNYKTEYTIESVDGHTIKFKNGGEVEYSELTCDSVKLGNYKYTKVN